MTAGRQAHYMGKAVGIRDDSDTVWCDSRVDVWIGMTPGRQAHYLRGLKLLQLEVFLLFDRASKGFIRICDQAIVQAID